MKNLISKFKQITFLILISVFVISCGGGSNPAPSATGTEQDPDPVTDPGTGSNPSTKSSKWNEMIWGDGNWG